MNVLYKIRTYVITFVPNIYVALLIYRVVVKICLPDCCTIRQAMTAYIRNVRMYAVCEDTLLHYSTRCVGVAVIHVVVPLFKEHEECKLLASLRGCLHGFWLSRLSVSCSSKHNVRCHKCGTHAHNNTVSKLHTPAPM